MFLHFLHLFGVPKVVPINVLLYVPLLVAVYKEPLYRSSLFLFGSSPPSYLHILVLAESQLINFFVLGGLGVAVPSFRSLWGAVRKRRLYILQKRHHSKKIYLPLQ